MVKFQYSDTTTIWTFSLYIMVCFTADFFSVKFFTFITCMCVRVHCHAQSLIVLLHQSFYDKSLLTLVDTGHLHNAICMFTHLISAKVFYTDMKQNCLKYRLTVLTGHVNLVVVICRGKDSLRNIACQPREVPSSCALGAFLVTLHVYVLPMLQLVNLKWSCVQKMESVKW